ncbi:MAG: DoxX family protein [Actinomycetota bacterium]
MSDAAGILVLIGRILFSVFFIFAGLGFHVAKSKMAEGYAGQSGFPFPSLTGWPTGLWMTAGALSVSLGIWPDVGALMIAAFVIPAALYFHTFWKIDDPMQKQTQQAYFFRNVIALGGVLLMVGFFAAVGSGLRYAITEPLFSF